MYQNVPYNGTRDEIGGKDLEKVNLITTKEREFRKSRYVEEMAHYAMLWLKYFRNENTSYYGLVNSVLCHKFSPEAIDYDCSKVGLLTLTKDFAIDLAPYVNVNAIAPGWGRYRNK